jgi:hypothetical protein
VKLDPGTHKGMHSVLALKLGVIIVQENIISNRDDDQFSLEVLTPIGDVVLNIGI